MRSSILPLAVAATLTSLVSAEGPSCQHKSDITKQPSGNPIATPGSTSEVPVGIPYDITWQNTTTGSVSLVLLRGPSTNAVDFLCIVDSIPNSGSYSWTPPTSLENDVSHYGIKIVVDSTGDYQYSTQFGIVNDGSKEGAGSTTTPATGKQTSSATTTTLLSMRSTQKVYQTSTTTVPCSSYRCTNNPTPTTTTTSTTPLTSKTAGLLSFTGTGPARANSTTFGATGSGGRGGGSVGTTVTPSKGLMPTGGGSGTASMGYSNRTATEPSPTKPITKPTTLGVKTSAGSTSLLIQTTPLSSSQVALPTTTTRPPPAAQTGNSAVRVGGMGIGEVVIAGLVGLLVVV